jgi:capsular exopolysaccharide synthesis family protein
VSKIYKALARAEAERGSEPIESFRASHMLVPDPHEEGHLDLPERLEEYEKLRVMLTLEANRAEFKSVMLVSALAGEGVSTVTLGLAATMAERSRQGVVVVDLDSTTPTLAGRLGLSPRCGLGELLAKEATRSEAVIEAQLPHLFLLGHGKVKADFSRPSSLALFEELLKGMRSDFDFIVLDGGALETCSDSLLVSGRVDGVIIVVQADRTGADPVREASSRLKMAGANVLGVVLNRRRDYLPNFISRKL